MADAPFAAVLFDFGGVFTGRAPSGQRVAPDSIMGPPSPRPQKPYCSRLSGTAMVKWSKIAATSTSAGVHPARANS